VVDGILTAITSADGVPVIPTTVRVGDEIPVVGRRQLRYITEVGGQLTSGLYSPNASFCYPGGESALAP